MILVGQAPGPKERDVGKPFAFTAGTRMFSWFARLGAPEEEFRRRVWIGAVIRCFPGRQPQGGDRPPGPEEIANCAPWLEEEIRIIRPAVEGVRASGVDCAGPLPSDTIFLRARAGHFDAVVMMYHDQGQIATKLLGFQKGVTVSAGMKTVYATPAHGTAFDIVGKGRADPGAMTAAFGMAVKLGAAKSSAGSRPE